MQSRGLIAIVLTIVAATALPAWAQSADALRRAQASFDQAQSNYLQGKYDDAARGFQDAYAARPFPQFLYNIAASFHMKGKTGSNAEAYGKAVEYYRQYLKEEPGASDRPRVEKAIGVLEAEIQRLRALAQQAAAPGAGTGSADGAGSAAAPTPVAASQEVQSLGDVKVRGLVVIVTEPQNATIYLDSKKQGKFAETPWSGSIDGEHKLILEKRGYKPVETVISADPTKLVQVISVLSQEDYLAWIEVTSNVPGADIYIDDKSIGAVGKTPLVPGQNIKPGKHTFWITAEGYDEYTESIDIAPGETKAIRAKLAGTPVGKLTVSGIDSSRVLVDGKLLCNDTLPCSGKVPEGSRLVEVRRDGFKTYRKRVQITAKTETTLDVKQAEKPGRGDAVAAFVFAGLFGGAGAYLGLRAQSVEDELAADIVRGMPPVDTNDARFREGKLFAYAADACFAIGGVSLLTAIYYSFRDKGPPSRGKVEVRSLALTPQVAPTFAGLAMEASW